jgi:hypothetical protein
VRESVGQYSGTYISEKLPCSPLIPWQFEIDSTGSPNAGVTRRIMSYLVSANSAERCSQPIPLIDLATDMYLANR